MATDKEYKAVIDALSGECERLHKENEELKALSQEPCEVSEYDKDHIWYKGGQYISLRRFLEVKAEAEKKPCDECQNKRTSFCGNCKEYDEFEPCKGQTMTREEREAAIAYIKYYRKLDEDLHNTSPKDSVSYYATDKCLKYWDMAIKALSQINDIKAIINNPMYIQEDVLRYQMICEVVKE